MRTASVSIVNALFDRGGVKAIFDHARNAVVATIIVAAGLDTAKRIDVVGLVGLLNPLVAGYFVAGTGGLLVILNFVDGLRKLARFRRHVYLQIAFFAAYLFVSVRVVQLIIFMRTHLC